MLPHRAAAGRGASVTAPGGTGPLTAGAAPPEAAEAGWLDRAFAPVWAWPWEAHRLLWVGSQVYAHALRWPRLGDAYGSDDLVMAPSFFRFTEYVRFTATTATGLWAAAAVGLALAGVGGRAAKPGVALYLAPTWLLLFEEGLNIKAHDRLAAWLALGLLVAPLGRGDHRYRSPAARWYLLVVFTAIYGSTGLLKAWHEPGWFDGTVLQAHLHLHNFAGSDFAVFMATQRWFTFLGGWWTVIFELAFPFLVWSRRANPWLLATGAVFHLAILALMDVGAFSFVSLSAYPVLLHPDAARAAWERLTGRRVPR